MKPVVGVIMGSKSDWDTMSHAVETLENLSIPFEVRVVSAHRTPDLLFEYCDTARERGLKVIIAGAGGAEHSGPLRGPPGIDGDQELGTDRRPGAGIRDRFAFIERKRLTVIETARFCFVPRAELDRVKYQERIVDHIISEYKKKRRG